MKIFTIFCSLMFACSIFASAQSDPVSNAPECIGQVDRELNSGQWIKLATFTGRSIEGYLAGISYELSTISIVINENAADSQLTCPFDDVEQIGYYSRGNIRPGYIIAGLLGGAIIGGIIGAEVGKDSKEMFGDIGALFAGIGIGAVSGAMLGIGVSVKTKKLVTIECDF